MRSVALAALIPLFFSQAAAPSKAKVHGFAVSGTVATLDEGKRTLVVRGSGGKTTTLVWTDATSVFGGKLSPGQFVTLRYLDRDGKHIATSIRIGPPPTPRPASTPSATPSAPAPGGSGDRKVPR